MKCPYGHMLDEDGDCMKCEKIDSEKNELSLEEECLMALEFED